jgi:glycosyltransferase involved in cell wall biosynthesis
MTGIACLGSRSRRVFHRHHGFTRKRRHARAGWLASALTDSTFVVSQSTAEYARQEGVAAEKIRVIYNGIADYGGADAEEVESVQQKLGVSPGDKVVLWVGRLREEKALPLLVRNVVEARRHMDTPAHLVIVGDGPDADSLRTTINPTEHIHFVGHQDDVRPWYAIADVFASTSPHETGPLVVLEAMSAGKPVVASARDGFLEAVENGVTGLLVDPYSAEEFGQALARVLGDPAYGARLGAAGRARYETLFTTEQMVRSWREAYGDMLAGREVSDL